MSKREFDHMVHHRDPKTGKIVRETPYSMECHGPIKFYRRDGKCFDGAGNEIPDPAKGPDGKKLSGIALAENFNKEAAEQPFTRSQTAQPRK